MAEVNQSLDPAELFEGYDIILVDPAKGGLMCCECNKVLRNAVQTLEGNRLCEPCYKKIKENSPNFKSPRTGISVLGEDGKPWCYPDKAVRREVQQLQVKCHNVTFDCPWTGPLSDYFKTHRAQCKYKPIRCPNKGCKELLTLKKVKKHQQEECLYRSIECEYCKRSTVPAELKEHRDLCPKFPVKCPHCGKEVPREEMEEHNLSICPKAVCTYYGALGERNSSTKFNATLCPGHKICRRMVRDTSLFDKYQCPQCSFLMKDALMTECGHWLCKSCADELLRTCSPKCPCSDCHEEMKADGDQGAKNHGVRQEISAMLVCCLYRQEGCKWNGMVKCFEDHLETCKFVSEQCPDCRAVVLVRQLRSHKEVCPKAIVRCPYADIGCPYNCPMTRRSLDQHLRDHRAQHARIATERINDVETDDIPLQPPPSPSPESFRDHQKIRPVMGVRSGTAVCSDLQLVALKKDNEMLREENEQFEAEEKQQEAEIRELEKRRHRLERPKVAEHSSGVDSSRLVNVEKRYEELEKQVSLLKLHVSELELQLQASLASTHNGSFLWRIPDMSRRRRDAIDGRITSIYSPSFYTGRNGYKMCIRAYLNGDGTGYKTHLSLFFVIMKGEFDALLRWPFNYKVSLILVDQNHRKHIVQTFKPTPESNSFQRPVSDMNVASGCPQFVKLSVLDDEAYVKDDVLFLKCVVDTTRILHP